MTEDEQSDVLAGKQVETGGGGLIGLRPVVEYRVQSETVMGVLKWKVTLKRRPSILMIDLIFAFNRRVFSRGMNA